MENCYQFEGINMIQHGEMVHDWYSDLMGPMNYRWDFGKATEEVAYLKQFARSPAQMRCYHIYHDCGKPFCRTIDENGRQHFPDHANVSADTWLSAGGCSDIEWYIRNDMAFHIHKGNELVSILEDSRASSLLLTAWSELHANASMFGGVESTSFKIKRKFLERNTRDLYDRLRA